MEDVARHKLFQHKISLLVTQPVDVLPNFFLAVTLLNAHRARHQSRFEDPRRRHFLKKIGNVLIMKRAGKRRHLNPAFRRSHAHGQLVAEVASRRFSKARQPQMLPQQRRLLQIEIIQRHNPLNLFGPAQMVHALHHVQQVPFELFVGHVVDLVVQPFRPLAL